LGQEKGHFDRDPLARMLERAVQHRRAAPVTDAPRSRGEPEREQLAALVGRPELHELGDPAVVTFGRVHLVAEPAGLVPGAPDGEPVLGLLGGELPEGDGFFYPVTLLTEVSPDMAASCEETFGPVAVVMRAETAEDAVRMANDTAYGLAASVWTTAERGEAMAREIEAGQVAVNGIVKTDPRLPSGGVKRSGYGRELGPHGIRGFVNVQQVWVGPKQT
jgi:hypothetical protein